MEDFLGFIVLFLIFVLGPILEQARKKQQRPPPRRPGTPPPGEVRPVPPPPVQRTETEDVSATTMLPDELWEVLTGQPRPRPAPQPVPAPDVEFEEVDFEEVVLRNDEEMRARRTREEPVSLETYTRHEVPVVVSLEDPPPEPRIRHQEFHHKLDRSEPVPVARPVPAIRPRLDKRADLRQAVMLQAILGPPKALE